MFFILLYIKIADQPILTSPTAIEQVPAQPHAEGRGAVSISTSRMAKGTICPCWSSLSWELALFCNYCMIEFSFL
jgi:hypothetical protein